jgi:DNA-directed RNA polymerase specialized sigma24 family protein
MEDGIGCKQDWVLTEAALAKVLSYLDPDKDQAARKFLNLRRGLQKIFEGRGCNDPDRLVDITIDRGARRIDEGVEVRDPFKYFGGVARFVLKEHWVSPERKMDELEGENNSAVLAVGPHNQAEVEKLELEERLECLEKCAGELAPAERQRVIDYYVDQGRTKIDCRKQLAEEMRISLVNLRVRMHRTREKLEKCILECLKRTAP